MVDVTEVADSFLNECVGCDEFQALHLAEIGILPHHIDEE